MRTRSVWGDGVDRLATAHVIVAGLGGVGCIAVESLARAGVGRLTLIDMDKYETSNLNRQLFSTRESLGRAKTEVAKERILSINPDCAVDIKAVRLTPENIDDILSERPDVVIDAIDTVTSKLALAKYCADSDLKLISCLGTGNRSNPTLITHGDIKDTAGCGCPLARVMRSELKSRGIESLSVVYSKEQPLKTVAPDSAPGRHSPGSTPLVPNAAGLALSYLALSHLMGL